MSEIQDKIPPILLVDDEAAFRSPLAKRLQKRNFTVLQAESAEKGLAVLQEIQTALVVMDVKMPQMDGLTGLSIMKKNYPDTEVILLTGKASTQDGVDGIKKGAFDYLSKPIEFEHLLGKIRQALEKIERIKEKEKEVKFRSRMERRMALTERLAALGTLAAGVAHEINNPLAIINESAGWLDQRMKRHDDLPLHWQESLNLALGKIQTSVDRAKRITHQLLTLARRSPPEIREVDIAELAREVMNLTSKTSKDKHLSVSLDIKGDETIIWSDPHRLRQVILNLVVNAIQACAEKGQIKIKLSPHEENLILTVFDDGHGIAKENLERIFEPFFSTRPAGKGSGLGLSVSRGILEELQGQIEVDSSLGKGSTFTVTLPKCPTDMAKEDSSEIVMASGADIACLDSKIALIKE